METIFIKPVLNLKVRDPERGTYLPEEGAFVPKTTYWLRRLQGGDAVITQATTLKKEIK